MTTDPSAEQLRSDLRPAGFRLARLVCSEARSGADSQTIASRAAVRFGQGPIHEFDVFDAEQALRFLHVWYQDGEAPSAPALENVKQALRLILQGAAHAARTKRPLASEMKCRPAPRRACAPQTARVVPRARGAGRPKGHAARRSSAASGDSGDSDSDGPGEAGLRVCACGCGRDISHKRAGARTFDAACRKRISRKEFEPPLDELDRLLVERAQTWAHRLSAEFIEQYLDDLWDGIRRDRAAVTPVERDDQLHAIQSLMESNGTHARRPRRLPRRWATRPGEAAIA